MFNNILTIFKHTETFNVAPLRLFELTGLTYVC